MSVKQFISRLLKPKRKIEDVINAKLTGEAQKNALAFVAHLEANGIPLGKSNNYFWNATYKGKGLCVINIAIYDDHSSFDIFINELPSAWEREDFPVDERTREIIWANVRPCDPTCRGKCSPGSSKIIFGKQFDNLCGSFLGIYDPDAETVDCMKKIIDGLKNDVEEAPCQTKNITPSTNT